MTFSSTESAGQKDVSVLITREREKAVRVAEMVLSRGGTPVLFPTIETRCLVDEEEKGKFFSELSTSTWVAFTSPRAVEYLVDLAGGDDLAILSGKKIAAVGERTELALRAAGASVDIVPGGATGGALGVALAGLVSKGEVVFFPRAREGRREIIDIFEERGIDYISPPLYETSQPPYRAQEVRSLIEKKIDYATFTSPSTFRNLLGILGKDSSSYFFKNVKIAVIGETTASFVREMGYEVSLLPDRPDVRLLVDLIFEDRG